VEVRCRKSAACSNSLHRIVRPDLGVVLIHENSVRIPDSGGIEKLMLGSFSQLWKPKAIHLVTRSDLTPGFDIVAFLENSDGLFNELRLVLGVTNEPDAPRIIQERAASCRLSIFWNEVEVIDRVLLFFKSESSLASLFLQLVTTFNHMHNTILMDRPNGQDKRPAECGSA